MSGMGRALKSALATGLRRSGALKLVRETRLRQGCTVLMYHRVISAADLPRASSNPGIIVPESDFDFQMATVRQWFKPLTLTQFQEHLLSGEPFPRYSCLVTFDDGWLDNYETAFPVLRRHEVPAAVFLPVDYVASDKMFWQEEVLMWLIRLLEQDTAAGRRRLAELMQSDLPPDTLNVNHVRQHVVDMKALSYEDIDATLGRLRAEFGSDGPPGHYNRYMNWNQVRDMRDAGIEFGSHAMTHRVLTRLDDETCLFELKESRARMQKELDVAITTLAYPNGDHDERVRQMAADAGYTVAFTTQHGICSSACEPLAVPRLNLHGNNGRNESVFLTTCLNLF